MKQFFTGLKNNKGSVLIIALFVLALSTIIGMIVVKMSNIELKASANLTHSKMAFYAAESARSFVAQTPDLYGPDNLTPSNPFDGYVQYLGMSEVPRGSGFEVGTFKAYRYKMVCNGYGPSGAKSQIEAGFYRVGY
ncbi:MAG: hypothetical protein JRI90_04260 [Deltaproteobacteria bacterium]|nr:hypothetical protein [Deltaproteobacteria bacterium]